MKRMLLVLCAVCFLASCQGREISVSEEVSQPPAGVSASASEESSPSSSATPSESVPPPSSSEPEPVSSTAPSAEPIQRQLLPAVTILVLDQAEQPVINRQLWLSYEGKLLQRDFLDSYGQQVWNRDGTAKEGNYTFGIPGVDGEDDLVNLYLTADQFRENDTLTLRLAKTYPEHKERTNLTATLISQQTGEPLRNLWVRLSVEGRDFNGHFMGYSNAEGKAYGYIASAGDYAVWITKSHNTYLTKEPIYLEFDIEKMSEEMEVTLEVDTDLMADW